MIDMDVDLSIFDHKELIVRKKVARFIEKLFVMQNNEISHDRYKEIIYNNKPVDSSLEEKIKNFYDGYFYLLNNYQTPFTSELLKRFLYILFGREAPSDLLIRLGSSFFHIMNYPSLEHSIDFLIQSYKDIVEYSDNDKIMVCLMLFNYCLVKTGIPTIVIFDNDYFQLLDFIKNDDKNIYPFLTDLVIKNKIQDVSYYKNLQEIDCNDIYRVLLKDKDKLNNHGIEHISIFGSFAKNSNRIDSDIDLLVTMDKSLPFETKRKSLSLLAEEYFEVFKRFVDFVEISEYVSDKIIREVNHALEVF